MTAASLILCAALAGVPDPALRVQADARGTVATFVLPAFDLAPDRLATAPPADSPFAIRVEGFRSSVEPGYPELPSRGFFLALPPGADARLTVEEDSFHDVEGVWIAPPATTRIDDGEREGAVFASVPDAGVYATDAFVPAAPAHIAMHGVVRDLDFARVELSPFQWNPVTRTLRVHDRFSLCVAYGAAIPTGDATGGGGGARWRGPSLRNDGPAPGPPPAELVSDTLFANAPVPAAWHVRRPAADRARIDAATNPAASGEAWKLQVKADGLYRVAYADLQVAGLFASGPVRFADLRLELRGRLVPFEAIDKNGDGFFDAGDAIEFYGVANPERWTATHVYWLTRSGGGARMQKLPAFPAGASAWAAASSVKAVARVEKNEVTPIGNGYDPAVFEPWVFSNYTFRVGKATTVPPTCYGINFDLAIDVPTPNLVPPDPAKTYSLRGQFLGVPGTCTVDTQQVDVAVNLAPTGSVVWSLLSAGQLKAWSLPVDARNLQPATNRIALTMPDAPDDKVRFVYADWIELEYEMSLRATAGVLEFRGTWPTGRVFYVAGLASADVEVVDVRSDGRVDRLAGTKALSLGPGAPVTIAFALAPEAGVTHRVAVYQRSAILTPAVAKDIPSNLRAAANRGTYVAIAHASLLAATKALTDYRATEGLSTQLVDVQDVYDEFSWGNLDSQALQDFLATALAGWTEPPLYAVLVGDSTFDFKNYYQHASSPLFVPHRDYYYQPPLQPATTLNGDSYYQMLVGSDAVPDLLLGRISVQTASEVATYVQKVKTYEASSPAAWNGRSLLLVDDDIEGNDTTCGSTASLGEQFMTKLHDCYLSTAGPSSHLALERDYGWPAGRQVIVDDWNAGLGLQLYWGHGSHYTFGAKCATSPRQLFFQDSDLPSLTNTTALPLSTTISCIIGEFMFVDKNTGTSRTLAETFTVTRPTGSIAFIATTTETSSLEGWGQAQGILDGLYRPGSALLPPFGDRRRAGAIHFAGLLGLLQNKYYPGGGGERAARSLVLLGDPALNLKIGDPAGADPDHLSVTLARDLVRGRQEGC